ncbi:MAG: metallophosphoesterase [Bacteroidales bacterium]|nr:metallophosphoesterase [Bacteroidales bacterium]
MEKREKIVWAGKVKIILLLIITFTVVYCSWDFLNPSSDNQYEEEWYNPFLADSLFANGQTFNMEAEKNCFVVYGDNRNEFPVQNDIHREILGKIAEQNADFIINLGDMVRNVASWNSFFEDIELSEIDIPFIPVKGNHDTTCKFSEDSQKTKAYYSINYGQSHLIILANNNNILSDEQLLWFMNDLEIHTDYPRKFVFAHKPLYSGANNGVREKLIEQIDTLLVQYNVTAFFGGHYHCYERLSEKDIVHFVSGGGGAPLMDLKNNIPQLQVHETTYHYMTLKLSESAVLITVYNIDNEIIDQITLD